MYEGEALSEHHRPVNPGLSSPTARIFALSITLSAVRHHFHWELPVAPSASRSGKGGDVSQLLS